MSLPNIGNNGFYLLNMNIGTSAHDYGLLHEKHTAGEGESISSLLKECAHPEVEKRGIAKEKLFRLAERADLDLNELTEAELSLLATLLFNEGLDIIESNIHRLSPLIESHIKELLPHLHKRISDAYGSAQFKELFPKLYNHLKTHHNEELPELLKAGEKENIQDRLKRLFSPFYRGQQSIKDRLSTSFFEKVVTQSQKPAVITLQEVYGSTIPQQLEAQGYRIIRSHPDSDTLIAIESSRFEEVIPFDLGDRANGVHVKDKNTGEEFVFISTHIPGYNLVIPQDEKELKQYLLKVKESLDARVFLTIQDLSGKIQALKERHPQASIVLQGDFNTFPEYFKHAKVSKAIKALNIFKALKKNGLTLFRTNKPTELNSNDPSFKERELDFVLVSSSLRKRVKIVSPKDQELSLARVEKRKVHFDPMLLPSDHIPIWTKISGKKHAKPE